MQESQALMGGVQHYALEDERFAVTRCPGSEPFMMGRAPGKTWNSSLPSLESLGTVRCRYGKLCFHLQGLPSPERRLPKFPTCHTSRPATATVAECWPGTSKVLVSLWGRYPVSCVLWKVTLEWNSTPCECWRVYIGQTSGQMSPVWGSSASTFDLESPQNW